MSVYGYVCLNLSDKESGPQNKIFESDVLGIEVTIPALAKRCSLGNLDHHGLNDTAKTPCASEQAMQVCLPSEGAILATVCADADSVTAMAILTNRKTGLAVDPELVRLVSEYDRYGPSVGRPKDILIAVSRISSDSKRSLADRVRWIQSALTGEIDLNQVRELVDKHDSEFNEALKASKVELVSNGRIALITSSHRFATRIGYMHSQVLVCYNPEMPANLRDSSSGTIRKFTVCRFNSHVPCDLPSALSELQQMEPGWGGRADIFGSPLGVSSNLEVEEVVGVVEKYFH